METSELDRPGDDCDGAADPEADKPEEAVADEIHRPLGQGCASETGLAEAGEADSEFRENDAGYGDKDGGEKKQVLLDEEAGHNGCPHEASPQAGPGGGSWRNYSVTNGRMVMVSAVWPRSRHSCPVPGSY